MSYLVLFSSSWGTLRQSFLLYKRRFLQGSLPLPAARGSGFRHRPPMLRLSFDSTHPARHGQHHYSSGSLAVRVVGGRNQCWLTFIKSCATTGKHSGEHTLSTQPNRTSELYYFVVYTRHRRSRALDYCTCGRYNMILLKIDVWGKIQRTWYKQVHIRV